MARAVGFVNFHRYFHAWEPIRRAHRTEMSRLASGRVADAKRVIVRRARVDGASNCRNTEIMAG